MIVIIEVIMLVVGIAVEMNGIAIIIHKTNGCEF